MRASVGIQTAGTLTWMLSSCSRDVTPCAFSTGYPPLQPASFTHPSDRQEGTAEHRLQISFKTLSGPVKDLEAVFVREEWEARLKDAGQLWNALSLL